MAIDYAATEQALLAWLTAATGIAAGPASGGVSGVYLDLAKVPQPAMPYLTVKLPEPQRAGGPDELRWSSTAGTPAGAELTATVYGQREVVVSVQAYTLAATGAGTAKELLARAQTALALQGVRGALNAAGLAFVGIETLQDLSARLGPVGQGRAVMDVRFRIVDSASETTTYIQQSTPTPTWS